MLTKLKESTLFKSLSGAFHFDRKRIAKKAAAASQKDASKIEVVGNASFPDAVWHRSKPERRKEN